MALNTRWLMIYKVFFSLTVADVRFVLFVHIRSFGPSATGSSVLRENTSRIYESLSDESFPLYTSHLYMQYVCVCTHWHTLTLALFLFFLFGVSSSKSSSSWKPSPFSSASRTLYRQQHTQKVWLDKNKENICKEVRKKGSLI